MPSTSRNDRSKSRSLGVSNELTAYGLARTSPAVLDEEPDIPLETISIKSVAGVDEVEQDIIEECLERRNRSAFLDEKRTESIGRSDAER